MRLPLLLAFLRRFLLCAESDECYQEKFPTAELVVRSNVVYGSSYSARLQGSQELLMDVYEIAQEYVVQVPRPLAIFIHDGDCATGDKVGSPFENWAEMFARRNFVVANINYRTESNLPRCRTAGAVEAAGNDVKAAVRHFKGNAEDYIVDPENIFLAGTSSGATVAVWAAYADGNGIGPTNSVNNWEYNATVKAVIAISGELYAPNETIPVIDVGKPSLMVVHGIYDSTFYLESANQLFEDALTAGVTTRQLFVPGGHAPFDQLESEENISYLYSFIYQQLKVSCWSEGTTSAPQSQPTVCAWTPCPNSQKHYYCMAGTALFGCRPTSLGPFSALDCEAQCTTVD